MANSNPTLTERAIEYDAEIMKNPFRILIPGEGDRMIHGLFQEIRHYPTLEGNSLIRGLACIGEGSFYTAKYAVYLGLAIKAGEIASKLF